MPLSHFLKNDKDFANYLAKLEKINNIEKNISLKILKDLLINDFNLFFDILQKSNSPEYSNRKIIAKFLQIKDVKKTIYEKLEILNEKYSLGKTYHQTINLIETLQQEDKDNRVEFVNSIFKNNSKTNLQINLNNDIQH